ncbi:MAG: phospholipase D-like domain-containing protein [Burkholderiaceae bacterium]
MIWIVVATAIVLGLVAIVVANVKTSEKRIERRIPHRHPVADPQFQREMAVMLGPGIVPGNRVDDLQNGREIFPAMLEAIESAQRTITFETFIYWSGDIGERFSSVLSERAAAGVEVRVLLDWVGSLKMDSALIDRMRESGVDVRHFRPLRWYNVGRMNNRTHRKLLVVDGRIGFTGGVGIADQWDGDAGDPEHWRDMHFRVEGPVVAQFQAAFNDNWIRTTGMVLDGAAYFPELEPAGDIPAQMFIASPAGGSESMRLMYLMSIAAAVESIDMQAAYFVPDAMIIRALLEARERGVRIRVVLAGPHIDSDAVRLASRAQWGRLLEAGVEIAEYQPTMLHNKLLVVDGELVSVGSTNFDVRSFELNEEASLNIYSRAFAARMTGIFEADLASARAYTLADWRARPLRARIKEAIVRPLRSQL